MNEKSRFILDFLREENSPIMGSVEELVARISAKLDIHGLSLTKDNLKIVVDEYGDEVLNPMNDVIFDDDNY